MGEPMRVFRDEPLGIYARYDYRPMMIDTSYHGLITNVGLDIPSDKEMEVIEGIFRCRKVKRQTLTLKQFMRKYPS